MKKSAKKWIWILVIALLVGGGYFLFFNKSPSTNAIRNVSAAEVTVYKSSSCGCCGLYASGLKGANYDVKTVDTNDQSIKKDVPLNLRSCHTTIVGNYFVEGHVPYEAIDKLLEEKPDIAGIALQGMPSGSPGMTGFKSEPFIIYAVNHDGTYYEFMRV